MTGYSEQGIAPAQVEEVYSDLLEQLVENNPTQRQLASIDVIQDPAWLLRKASDYGEAAWIRHSYNEMIDAVFEKGHIEDPQTKGWFVPSARWKAFFTGAFLRVAKADQELFDEEGSMLALTLLYVRRNALVQNGPDREETGYPDPLFVQVCHELRNDILEKAGEPTENPARKAFSGRLSELTETLLGDKSPIMTPDYQKSTIPPPAKRYFDRKCGEYSNVVARMDQK